MDQCHNYIPSFEESDFATWVSSAGRATLAVRKQTERTGSPLTILMLLVLTTHSAYRGCCVRTTLVQRPRWLLERGLLERLITVVEDS